MQVADHFIMAEFVFVRRKYFILQHLAESTHTYDEGRFTVYRLIMDYD